MGFLSPIWPPATQRRMTSWQQSAFNSGFHRLYEATNPGLRHCSGGHGTHAGASAQGPRFSMAGPPNPIPLGAKPELLGFLYVGLLHGLLQPYAGNHDRLCDTAKSPAARRRWQSARRCRKVTGQGSDDQIVFEYAAPAQRALRSMIFAKGDNDARGACRCLSSQG